MSKKRLKQRNLKIVDGKYHLKENTSEEIRKQAEDYAAKNGIICFHLDHYFEAKCPACFNKFPFITPGGEGMPDDLFWMPRGILLAEFKNSEKEELRPKQQVFYDSLPMYYKNRYFIFWNLQHFINIFNIYKS